MRPSDEWAARQLARDDLERGRIMREAVERQAREARVRDAYPWLAWLVYGKQRR